jgi:xanthine dehydrogenase accessory factor
VKEIVDELERWRQRGERFAVATVVATRLSAPRPIGSKFGVSETGELCGSVSGGCVESDIAEEAKEVLATGEPKLLSYGISDEDALGVGLPCGGEIDVFLERFD